MKRVFTILAFIALTAVSSFGQSYDGTTVEEVQAADFAIEGGMVYSAGVIKVYNVLGQAVAKSSQEFNVNTLPSGRFYAIVAEEGTIKFVK